jgi:hypothetical protein
LAALGGPDQRCPSVDAIAVDRDNSDFADPIFGGAEARRFDIDKREASERVQNRALLIESLHCDIIERTFDNVQPNRADVVSRRIAIISATLGAVPVARL